LNDLPSGQGHRIASNQLRTPLDLSDDEITTERMANATTSQKMGDTLTTLKKPSRTHAKPYSREQTIANIATIQSTVPLEYVNARLDQEHLRMSKIEGQR